MNNLIKTESVIAKEKAAVHKLVEKEQNVVQRFPLPFTLLATFGLVATFYGFEHLIDKVQFFADNPIVLLLTGLAALGLTGTLYKKLG